MFAFLLAKQRRGRKKEEKGIYIFPLWLVILALAFRRNKLRIISTPNKTRINDINPSI